MKDIFSLKVQSLDTNFLSCLIFLTNICFHRYETGSSLFTDVNCQRRAVCEVYKYQGQLGELSKRARHSLDFLDTLPYLNLPDEINEIGDELVVCFSFLFSYPNIFYCIF